MLPQRRRQHNPGEWILSWQTASAKAPKHIIKSIKPLNFPKSNKHPRYLSTTFILIGNNHRFTQRPTTQQGPDLHGSIQFAWQQESTRKQGGPNDEQTKIPTQVFPKKNISPIGYMYGYEWQFNYI